MGRLYVHYGAGLTAPDGWLNFDVSPTLRLGRIPVLRRFVKSPFPANVRYGDIVRGLPVADGTADGIFCSHVLEHLSRLDFDAAISNSFRMLKPGGRFRLIVPDLEGRVRRYVAAKEERRSDASDRLMRETLVGIERRPRSLMEHMRAVFGNSSHLWMWDYAGIHAALEKAGFAEIRQCQFGDSGDAVFDAVERKDRFFDEGLGIPECAVEARRP
jgi:predicted SAM-dependent methyltransferase